MSTPLTRAQTGSTAASSSMDTSFSSTSMTLSMSMSTSPSSITPSTGDREEEEQKVEVEDCEVDTPKALSRVSEPHSPVTSCDEEEGEERPLKRVEKYSCLALLLSDEEEESEMMGKRNHACPNLVALRRAAEEEEGEQRQREKQKEVELETAVFIRPRRVGTMRRAISVDIPDFKPSDVGAGFVDSNVVCFTATASKRRSLTHPATSAAMSFTSSLKA